MSKNQFFKFFVKIWIDIYENLKFSILGVRRAEPSEASEFIKNLLEKSMETANSFENLHEF